MAAPWAAAVRVALPSAICQLPASAASSRPADPRNFVFWADAPVGGRWRGSRWRTRRLLRVGQRGRMRGVRHCGGEGRRVYISRKDDAKLASSPVTLSHRIPDPSQFPQIGRGGSPAKNDRKKSPLLATLRQRVDDLWRCGNGCSFIH